MEILSYAMRGKNKQTKQNKTKGFQISHVHWSFLSDIRAVKGLRWTAMRAILQFSLIVRGKDLVHKPQILKGMMKQGIRPTLPACLIKASGTYLLIVRRNMSHNRKLSSRKSRLC